MTTNRAEQIAAIIEKRRPFAENIGRVQHNLQDLSSTLSTLDRYREQLANFAEPEVAGRLKDIGLSLYTIQGKIAEEQRELDKLKHRFSRETLNIGVVGRARQGKSRLLQSLSGLTSAEIPDGRFQHCTGVRSTIYHNPGITPYAEINFYSERKFLDDVIAPYYTEKHLRLGTPPYTLDDFASEPLPALPTDLSDNAEAKAKYEHLKGYRDNLDKYRSLLNENTPRTIRKEQIREYVAQDTANGQRVYSNYRAVQEVRIVCNFPHQDVGQIALVDMPGLGDTGVGNQERLIEALGEDIDIVLFVRMPKSFGDHWADVDMQLYELARSALTRLPIKSWSFMILNRTDVQSPGDSNASNAALCSELRNTITSDQHISVVDTIIANCANPAEVEHKILDKILDYLTANITVLDENYASSCQNRLHTLQKEIQIELGKASQALGVVGSRGEPGFALFEDLFEKTWHSLTKGLDGLVNTLLEQRGKQSPIFQKHVQEVLAQCKKETGIPSPAEIEERKYAERGYGGAYEHYLNEIRTLMTRRFVSLDDALKTLVRQVKEEVAKVLIESGHLEGVTEARGTEFLVAMAELLEFLPNERSALRQAFLVLATFELPYRSFIQYRVRRNLNGLNADLQALPKTPTAEAVHNILKVQQAETVYALQQAMEESLSDPSEVAFAIVEEFTDQVLSAERAKSDWRLFYNEWRAKIWSSEFGKFAKQSHHRRQWQGAVDRALQANRIELFQFLS